MTAGLRFVLLACALAIAAPPGASAEAAPRRSKQTVKERRKRERPRKPRRARPRKPRKPRKPARRAKRPPPPVEPAPLEMEPDDMTPATAEPAELTVDEPVPEVAAAAPAPAVRHPRRAPPRRRFYIRAGGAFIAPLSSSRELELADIDGAASLAVDNGPVAGSGASVSPATAFAATIGYRLTPRLAVEAVLGVPFTVKFRATGTLANESLAPMALGIPTGVPPLGEELGEAKAAPPTVSLVYELRQGRIRPYAGTGLTVLFAYDAKVTNPILAEVGEPEMSIAPAPGLVLQGGLDAHLAGRFYARLDVKFIAFLLARARVEHLEVRTPELPVFDTVEVGTAKLGVWVNPVIVQLGVGTDF